MATFGIAVAVVDPAMPFWLWRFLLSASVGLSIGLVVAMIIHRASTELAAAHAEVDPGVVLAQGLVAYAAQLAASKRDQTLVELRSSTSRLLHLMGANRERQAIGEFALEAAAALSDRISQASILLDDLGWSLFESGEVARATANVAEAIEILSSELDNLPEDSTLLELRSKAQRHLAVMRSSSLPLPDARGLLDVAKLDVECLPEPARSLGLAQLNFSDAAMILSSVESEIGPQTMVDSEGPRATLLQEGLQLVERANKAYADLGDAERQGKALALKVRYLKHDRMTTRFKEAQAQLDRIQSQIARNARALAT